jgi:hypothetical protein
MPSTTLQMTVNKPMQAVIKYVNVWPNDTTKNSGKGYGASLNLKGTFDGTPDASVYPKGFLNRNIQALVDAGVIEDGNYPHDPAERYSIPVVTSDVTLLLEQNAGEKYPTFKVLSDLDRAREGDKVAKPTNGNGAAPKASAPKAEAYESPGRLPNEDFRELVLRYRECAAAANEAWGKDTSDQALVAAAATLFIERNRKNV